MITRCTAVIVRRGALVAALATTAVAAAGCSDAAGPGEGSGGTLPPAYDAPSFVFTANLDGKSQLFLYSSDSVTRFITSVGNDVDAQSAAGLIVFSSDRDGSEDIYLTDIAGSVQRQVTNTAAADGEPSLSPSGDMIAFVRNGAGTPRIWIVAAPVLDSEPGSTPAAVPLQTGSGDLVPERSPVWSPDGRSIAFASARTGISQLFVVGASGGAAVQVTHEAGGAFDPAWSDDGRSIIYTAATGTTSLALTDVDGGGASELASDSLGIGQPSCALGVCVAVTDPLGDAGSVVVVAVGEGSSRVVLGRSSGERQPAMVVR